MNSTQEFYNNYDETTAIDFFTGEKFEYDYSAKIYRTRNWYSQKPELNDYRLMFYAISKIDNARRLHRRFKQLNRKLKLLRIEDQFTADINSRIVKVKEFSWNELHNQFNVVVTPVENFEILLLRQKHKKLFEEQSKLTDERRINESNESK